MQQDDIDNRFDYHAPTEDKKELHAVIRSDCRLLAHMLNGYLPEGREKSLAITHLEEVMMWANAAIARAE